ncbi:MAG: HD domain-containing protein [Phascolarctobacterium sp.]|nr:HD domain-containing protein [Phascolarctobacterium sp.]
MLTKSFLEFLYEAAHIQRWNDHIRPSGFTELDKQAHKMMILYVLARFEEDDHNADLNWRVLIEGGIFEFLHRNVLTDIKPPVFHELMRAQGKALNKWVYGELKRRIPDIDNDFIKEMKKYFDNPDYCPKEKKLLRAAHYLATQWEFNIIYPFNENIYGIEETRQAIEGEVQEHFDLTGVQKLALKSKTSKFIDLVGQLRFQKRWAQSPRVPETSVMGHVLLVAIMGYFCAVKMGACDERIVSDFLCGLFHDLPEVLTRDIISPVKRSVAGLDELIKTIEERQVSEKILPLLPDSWAEDILYYTQNEFADRVILNGKPNFTTIEEINAKYNIGGKGYKPTDGTMLKGCDHLAAFMEGWLSIKHGITSSHLEEGVASLRQQYLGKTIGGINFSEIYAEFE